MRGVARVSKKKGLDHGPVVSSVHNGFLHTKRTETGFSCLVSRFAMRNDRTMFLFTFADDDPALPSSVPDRKAALIERFGRSGWECPRILEARQTTDDVYFDRVSQIAMGEAPGSWANGHVTLVGDAAFCISLLGGQGSGLAMAAAYIPAGELHRARGRHADGFARYQQIFGPFVASRTISVR